MRAVEVVLLALPRFGVFGLMMRKSGGVLDRSTSFRGTGGGEPCSIESPEAAASAWSDSDLGTRRAFGSGLIARGAECETVDAGWAS